MATEYLTNTDRENVLRACRVLMESAGWLEEIADDTEAGTHANDEALVDSWRRCVTEANAALTALGYDKDLGN